MKLILLVTRADTMAGNQVHILELAKILQTQGHEILVVTGAQGVFTETLQQLQIPTLSCDSLQRSIHPLKDWQALLELRQIIKSFQPDIVAAHSSKAGILGRLVCKLNGIPCVFTAHGWAFTEGVAQSSRKIYQFLERLLEPLACQIICVSEYDRSIGLRAGMGKQRLITIHNGISDIPDSLRANASGGNPVKIVMIARFAEQKDYRTLLQACQSITNIQLDLVGDGPQLDEMKDLATTLGMTDRTNFLGFRQDIPEILAQAHIFTLVSNWEGFPITTLEAMRAGLPIVVSDVGGSAEAITEGATGYCVPRGDVMTLHSRLSELVANPNLRLKMGQAARQRYESEFVVENMFRQTLAVYEKVTSFR